MDLKDVGILLAIVSGVVGPAIGYGKMMQKMKDNHDSNTEKFADQARLNGDHYKLAREHDQRDQEHFLDTDAHWTSNERGWLTKTFEDLKRRLDIQDGMLKEILQRARSLK